MTDPEPLSTVSEARAEIASGAIWRHEDAAVGYLLLELVEAAELDRLADEAGEELEQH